VSAEEINFDGLVGPTHSYAGLSEGNLAAQRNQGMISHPRAAALQGIAKMRAMMSLGLTQGVLPPHERPNIHFLRTLGFTGDDAAVWNNAWRDAPHLARAAASASAMWAANAATISPSADSADNRLHASTANLTTMLHRAQEAPQTTRTLQRLLPDATRFAVHEALTAHVDFADEGAANHMRLASSPGAPGVEIFVYGREAGEDPGAFPARQTRAACEAIARRHGLAPERTVFIRQSRVAIDAGAFHNDVVAVSNDTTLFHHEHAFADRNAANAAIRAAAAGLFEPSFVEVRKQDVPIAEAVSSYLFNSQLIRAPGAAKLTLIAPAEVRESNRASAYVSELIASGKSAIRAVSYVDVRQSMRNGGGPACLRLRIVMTAEERAVANAGFFLTPTLADNLEAWVRAHYREELSPEDLRDPRLITESRTALDALTRILPLGSDFYPFQR
jgi:succinylarginine dihydrolase